MKKLLISVLALLVIIGVSIFIWKDAPSQSPIYSKLTVSKDLKVNKNYPIDSFIVKWDGKEGRMVISHAKRPKQEIFSTPIEMGFLAAGKGVLDAKEERGHFTMKENREVTCADQSVDEIESTNHLFIIKGVLQCSNETKVGYSFELSPEENNKLHYSVTLDDPTYNRIYLSWSTDKNEHYFGFGTQYSSFDMKGKRVPILVQEQGVGRGLQPLTFLADITNGAGGSWAHTYAPVPHFITSNLTSLYSENKEYQVFHLTDKKEAQLEVFSSHASGYVYAGNSPEELVEAHTSVVGRMESLPDWTQHGLILGVQGGTEKVVEKLDTLLEKDIPISAVWIQDWVGQRRTSFGSQLWWNWELDKDHYNNWDTFINTLKEKNIRLLGYVNPFLVDSEDKQNRVRNLYQEAAKKGYFVKDKNDNPIAVQITDFDASLIDLTNQEAREWFKVIMMEELIENGFSGWMADFGEALPFDAIMSNGALGEQFHNEYPESWAQLNKEVMEESNLETEGMFFLRSGYSESPSSASSFWLGDQLISWDEHDGIKTVVPGLISSGLSGFGINHSDTGGYTGLNKKPILSYSRSEELLLRWIELNAFTPLFRSHEGNRPEESVQLYNNGAAADHAKVFTDIYAALAPYRKQLMKEMEETGAPLVRSLFFHYPKDSNTYSMQDEFLLGEDLLVAPVLDKGKAESNVYLPKGDWIHLWSGKKFLIEEGEEITVSSPLGEPPVFYKKGSKVEKLLSPFEK
ncbi:alpha-glucosidase [Cytobacillus sp. FJAT-53684]|uniref:Alpha-glucosidase n=1 Tax=Cytobacillus mangrovibacter TaxID=3299024 RepID=A0ABW6JVR7_9BACI